MVLFAFSYVPFSGRQPPSGEHFVKAGHALDESMPLCKEPGLLGRVLHLNAVALAVITARAWTFLNAHMQKPSQQKKKKKKKKNPVGPFVM